MPLPQRAGKEREIKFEESLPIRKLPFNYNAQEMIVNGQTVIRDCPPRDDRSEIQALHHRALSQEAVWKADNLIVLSTQFIINIFIKLITENISLALTIKQWLASWRRASFSANNRAVSLMRAGSGPCFACLTDKLPSYGE